MFRSFHTFVCVALLCAMIAVVAQPVAAQHNDAPIVADGPAQAPEVDAAAWVLADGRSGKMLEGVQADTQLPMASITKIMTALVVLRSGVPLHDQVTVSEAAAAFANPESSNIGLRAGDQLSVGELLHGALMSSGNDAAQALAEHVGGDTASFVARMNEYAAELGLTNTRFANPQGIDDPEHYSSARDLAKLAATAMNYRVFRRIVSTITTTITTQDRIIPLVTTNQLLLTYKDATGVKTGTTPNAGPSVVASAARGSERYIVVVLNAAGDRFEAARTLLDYGFARSTIMPAAQNEAIKAAAPMCSPSA